MITIYIYHNYYNNMKTNTLLLLAVMLAIIFPSAHSADADADISNY